MRGHMIVADDAAGEVENVDGDAGVGERIAAGPFAAAVRRLMRHQGT